MIRFIHCADIHLGRSIQLESGMPDEMKEIVLNAPYISFENIVTEAIKQNVDFLLISGDLYDREHRSLRGQWFVKKQTERLYEENINVFIIHGNHDPLVDTHNLIHLPENVHVFSSEGEKIKYLTSTNETVFIHGVSYPEKAYTDDPLPRYEKAKDLSGYHIGMLHGQERTHQEHEPYAPFELKGLLAMGYHYWALGHIHQQKVLTDHPPVIYPGNVQGAHRKERGEKGAYLVELRNDQSHVSFFHTAPIIWDEVEVYIDHIEGVEQLVQEVLLKLPQSASRQKFIIEVNFRGNGMLHEHLKKEENREELRSLLREECPSGCWIHRLNIHTSPFINRQQLLNQDHLLGDIVRAADSLKQNDCFDDVLVQLRENRLMKKYIRPFSDEEEDEIIDSAEKVLLSSLMEESGEGW